MKSSYIYGLVLLGLVLSANALEAEIAGPGRDLLAKKAKCKFNDKKEYYGASYFIKLADATHQHGVKTCCELCAKEPGCRKFNFNGNGEMNLSCAMDADVYANHLFRSLRSYPRSQLKIPPV